MSTPERSFSLIGAGLAAALVVSLAAAPAQAAPAALFCDVPGQELAISPLGGDPSDEGAPVTWKTTIKGTTPETFAGEYIGKIDNALGYDAKGQPRDLLLVRLSGGPVDGDPATKTQPAGVWAGASGSPVYDASGALVGAVSYGFSSEADNIAGVTPAAVMKSIGDLPGSVKVSGAARTQIFGGARAATIGSHTELTQLKTVRISAGTSAKQLDRTAKRLTKRVPGYSPVELSGRAIAGGVDSGADLPIVTGGNIAVTYAHGALLAGSVGTVTAVCGKTIYAYGHPHNWDSSLGSSFHGASAARIVPSAGGSYKEVSTIGKPKGRITDDRLAGIKGTIGGPAKTIPITTVTRVDGVNRSRAVTHVSEKSLVSLAAAVQLATDAYRQLDNIAVGSGSVRWEIDYTRSNGTTGTLKNQNKYADEFMFPDVVGFDAGTDIAMLQTNGFETVRITAVRMTADFSQGNRASKVGRVEMKTGGTWKRVNASDPTKVVRGKKYDFRIVMRPAAGATGTTEYVPFTLTMPKKLRKTYKVVVEPMPVPDMFGDPDAMPLEATNLDGLLAMLDENARRDRLSLTKSYRTTSKESRISIGMKTTPRAVVGGKVIFKLQAAPLKPKKSAKRR